MKKLLHRFEHLFLAVTLSGLAILITNQACASDSDFYAEFPDQLDFPIIALQPLNQLTGVGGTATFEVVAENGPLTYQWLCNGTDIPGATNSILKLEGVTVEDVGLYSCNVAKGLEIVPTRGAQLMVHTARNNIEKSAGGGWALDSGGGFDVYATPVTSSGSSGSCPGSYAGYVYFTEGWGWVPSSGTSVHTATDATRTDTKVQYIGAYLDSGCNQTSVSIPHPTFSPNYEFVIYFTNNVPTDAYPITLDGFEP